MLGVLFTLLLGSCQAFTEGGSDHQCQIQLVSNWNTTPFSLQVIETLSSFDQSLYEPLLGKLIGSKEDEELTGMFNATNSQIYKTLTRLVNKEETIQLIDIHLANKFITPRIESHFHYYLTEVLPNYGEEVLQKCGSTEDAWAFMNGDIYCTPDDLFAIKASNKNQEGLLTPFDRLIGDSDSAVIVLYGRFEDIRFHELFKTLYEFAVSGGYRFVWRYIPSSNLDRPEILTGYGVDLTLKRVDYIAIDDRNLKKDIERKGTDKPQKEAINSLNRYSDDIDKVFDIRFLDLQFTKFITDKGAEGYHFLKKVILDFPKYASFLSTYSSDFSSVLESSKLDLEPGLYINGRPVDEHSMTVGGVVSILAEEFNFIDSFEPYSLGVSQAKAFIQDFASFIEKKTNDKSPVKRYKTTGAEGIVYLNDIERDRQYLHLRRDRAPYLLKNIKPGQIPAIRENVHDAVFVINLGDPIQLFHFIQFSSAVLNHELPQQIGIVPLIDNELDLKLSIIFLDFVHSRSIRAGFDFLQQIAATLVAMEDGRPAYDMSLINEFEIPSSSLIDKLLEVNRNFIKQFTVTRPHVILNGVFYDFSERWQFLVARQLFTDFLLIREALISEPFEMPLRDYLFKNSPSRRNTLILSDFPDFEGISKRLLPDFQQLELIQHSIIREAGACDSTPITLTLVGHFISEDFLLVLLKALDFQSRNSCLRLRLINASSDLTSFEAVRDVLEFNRDANVKERIQEIMRSKTAKSLPFSGTETSDFVKLHFEVESLFENEILVLLQGKVLTLNAAEVQEDDFDLIVENDRESHSDFIFTYVKNQIPVDDAFTWFESFSSMVLKSFLTLDTDASSIYTDDPLPRICTTCLDSNSISFRDYNADAKVDVVAIIEPTTEISQKILSFLQIFEGFDSHHLNINVILMPAAELESMNINRFYRGVYPNSVQFDENGQIIDDLFALFEGVPEKTLFTFDLDVPSAWVVGIKEGETDLDNVRLVDTGDVKGVYELENILVEGYLRGTSELDVGGIQVELSQGEFVTDTNVMTNLGYLQLKANPGVWNFQIKKNSDSADSFELLSADQHFSVRSSSSGHIPPVSIMDLNGVTVYPKFGPKKSSGMLSKSFKKLISRSFGETKSNKEESEINIFSVASGHLYERFLGIMTKSVMKHTKHSVKFWIIENYMSPTFRKNLPKLAEKYGFSYELVTYKWPKWLRPQREKQRTIWGYKILFLDVLFPQNLDKVIFVDADQIVRVDMKELVDLDLEGAPYGYTPMCDSRAEMEGFRFWKQGYWDKVLGENGLKYHISALYVIDLKKFREIKAGDILRHHYQALSADPASLSNLDQDLPNNLQSKIKIFSLPQEWLWCETWCSDESLKDAKTIDLCNNPLTKEPKLDRARRQVAEWTEYDDEINALLTEPPSPEPKEYQHDEL